VGEHGFSHAEGEHQIRGFNPEGCGIPTIRTSENQTRAGRPARVKFL